MGVWTGVHTLEGCWQIPTRAECMCTLPIYFTPGDIPNKNPYKYVKKDLPKIWKQPANPSTSSETAIYWNMTQQRKVKYCRHRQVCERISQMWHWATEAKHKRTRTVGFPRSAALTCGCRSQSVVTSERSKGVTVTREPQWRLLAFCQGAGCTAVLTLWQLSCLLVFFFCMGYMCMF